MWCHGVVVISTAQLHSTKPEVKFCAGSNPACGVSEIRHGEDLWQCSRLKIRLNAFRWSNLPQKQFIIINNPRFCKFFLYFFNSCLSISFTCVMQMVYIIRAACSWRKVLNFLTISLSTHIAFWFSSKFALLLQLTLLDLCLFDSLNKFDWSS